MKRRFLLLGLTFLLALACASAAQAATGPAYDVHATWGPTNLAPGDNKTNTAEGQFALQVQNVGDAVGAEDLTIVDKLPAGVTATAVHWPDVELEAGVSCSGVGTGEVKCVLPAALVSVSARPAGAREPFAGAKFSPIPSGYLPRIFIDVSVPKGASGEGANLATVSGGGAPAPDTDEDKVPFSKTAIPFGIVPGSFIADNFTEAFPSTTVDRQASDRPFEFRVDFDITAQSGVNDGPGQDGTRFITSNGSVRTVEATLPRGMIGNPEAVPKCDPAVFAETGALEDATACPPDTQVGYLNVFTNSGNAHYGSGGSGAIATGAGWVFANRVALYNLIPPKGVLADLGFKAGGLVQGHIYPTLDPSQDYAIKTVTPNISSLVQVRGSEVTTWGVPGDPAHDKFRWFPKAQENHDVLGAPWGNSPIRPFLTNPMDCGIDNGGAKIRLDSYNHPGEFSPTEENANHLNVTGCEDPRIRFEPEVTMQPTSRAAGDATGLDVNLKIPQRDDEVADAKDLYAANGNVKAISTPPLKKVVVTLPEGMTVSPSAAQGLDVCSEAQIGLGTDSPVQCPEVSQYGTLRLKSPALPQNKVITGRVYVAKPYENPFGSFLALYLAIEDKDLGLQVKLPGEVKLDPVTGQITTVFDDLPQLPASEAEVKVKGGLRAGLVNPQTCGKKTITATFYSWAERDTPKTVKSSYEITQGPGGEPCFNNLSERPFEPNLEAGTINPLAGAFSPAEIDFARTDTDQDLSEVRGTAPPGLLASIKGITRCSEAAIAAAGNPARTGTEEINAPSCPASSQVGTVDAGAGVGQVLTYVKGKVYLAGPYRGAPLSGVAIVPAVAGPFDLGTVVTRAPAYVDPVTAQLKLQTDPLPLIFKGVPVRVRDIRVHLDRPHFTLNPTNCKEMQIDATLRSSEGKAKEDSNRFQVGSCGDLGFGPRISLKLIGGTKRGGHPSLRAEVRPREGDANTASASVTLPHSAFLDQAHIRTICTRVQFAANNCPAASIYGKATVFTPLLDEPLKGPVYLRSSNHNLPDLVIALKGPPSLPIEFDLAGRVDSVNGGIRTSFESAPDAPFSKFILEMQGAKKGLVINSTNLCAAPNRSTAKLVGQNGKRANSRPEVVATKCAGKRKHAKRGPRASR